MSGESDMDIKGKMQKVTERLQKYKYVILFGVIGIALMMIPSGNIHKNDTVSHSQTTVQITTEFQQKLAEILSDIKGAGKVKVMLTEKVGEEKIYQSNEDISISESNTITKVSTVTILDADRNETGLVAKVLSPTYQGAIILCEGGDDPAVKLAISDAVSKITGLGTDKIAILKMK